MQPPEPPQPYLQRILPRWLRRRRPPSAPYRAPLDILNAKGEPNRWPLICPDCRVTYWMKPAERFDDVLPGPCAEAIIRMRKVEGTQDDGTAWWNAMLGFVQESIKESA